MCNLKKLEYESMGYYDYYDQIKIKIPHSTMNWLSAHNRVTNEMLITIKLKLSVC